PGGAMGLLADYYVPRLVGRDSSDVQGIVGEMDSIIDNPFTKAAVEMALLDLAGKRQGKPIYELLGGAKNALKIPIKFSIGLREPDDAANIAAGKVKEGFTAIKLKVGPDAEKDLARVKAVREAVGPNIRMNVDANGGWTVEKAIRETRRYEPYRLEYVEQPTPRWDIEGMAKVRQGVGVPIMADESVFTLWQAEQVIAKKAADLISIYPGKNGGILKAKKICDLAADAGIGCHLGSNLEWDLATAAMCHLAAACANVPVARFPVDILGPLYYAVKPRSKAIRFERGHVFVPAGNGLGVELCAEELEALAPSKGKN
ncbi:MAG TPA: mandelate racemase/muconate lactonizing enzyme family protein, partial [Tepidisphaeraceae bacterium]|nr:mandelate racemase/muconate lactonizing enzyme family protein [Tepidisphaeraceae bacterium]